MLNLENIHNIHSRCRLSLALLPPGKLLDRQTVVQGEWKTLKHLDVLEDQWRCVLSAALNFIPLLFTLTQDLWQLLTAS